MPIEKCQIVDVGGQRLNFELDGTPGAPWLVFSNSLATDLRLWDAQIRYLSKDWAILRYDFRGHGRSDTSINPSCSVATLADDLLAIMDAVGAVRVCHIGVSMGALAGVSAAIKDPSRFGSLVLCNSRLKSSKDSRSNLEKRARSALNEGMRSIVGLTLDKWFGDARLPLDQEARRDIERMIVTTRPVDFAAYATGMGDYDLEDDLLRLAIPISFLVGTDDGAVQQDFAALSKRSTRVRCAFIDGAGHLPNIHTPEQFNANLAQLIA